jgi:ADP-ribosylglycohydrolase
MRIAPLGLAYRNAPVNALHDALIQTLIPTHHLHPWAIEGALAQALAVAHLCKLQPGQLNSPAAPTTAADSPAGPAAAGAAAGGPPAGAVELLLVLQRQLQGRSDVMCSRLAAMEQGLKQVRNVYGGDCHV